MCVRVCAQQTNYLYADVAKDWRDGERRKTQEKALSRSLFTYMYMFLYTLVYMYIHTYIKEPYGRLVSGVCHVWQTKQRIAF